MGTSCSLLFYAQQNGRAKQLANQVIKDVQRLEKRYSRYRQDSFLSKINRVAAIGGSISVDIETAGLLNYAAACYNQSDGLFDITSGVLRRLWRFDSQCLPSEEAIAALLQTIGWEKLTWRPPVLTFLMPGMEIDFGGIVKEYAVDRVASHCWSAGIRHGIINLGGDIKIIGPQADGSPWRVGIRHPRNPDETLSTLLLTQGALASSGDYERCIIIDDVRYGHIINPKTGWPVQFLASVSVVGDFCVVAGSGSTIAMLKEEQGPQWLIDLGLDHVWMDLQNNIGGTLSASMNTKIQV